MGFLSDDGLIHVVARIKEKIAAATANKVDKVAGKDLSTNDYTTVEKNKLSGISAGAEVNQNAFGHIQVGGTTLSADQTIDVLTLAAGANVTLTPDAATDKVTISATDTTYNKATSVADGLMPKEDKVKLDTVASGANKTIVDATIIEGSTNPVQSKVIAELFATQGGDTDAVGAKVDTHIANKANPHVVTKSQIGLANVDNTSDANKPISSAAQAALNKKVDCFNFGTENHNLDNDKVDGHYYFENTVMTNLPESIKTNHFVHMIVHTGGGVAAGDAYVTQEIPQVAVGSKIISYRRMYDSGLKSWSAWYDDTIFSEVEKSKLAGLSNYTHPPKHPASMVTETQMQQFSSDTEKAVWNAKASTAVATASANGLMVAADKSKLDSFSTAANYALKADIVGMYKYKGSVATAAALPTTGQKAGDVYNIASASIHGAAGANVAWDGTKWDSLGEIFTITAITNAEIDAMFA